MDLNLFNLNSRNQVEHYCNYLKQQSFYGKIRHSMYIFIVFISEYDIVMASRITQCIV